MRDFKNLIYVKIDLTYNSFFSSESDKALHDN